jgi:plastocyanin
MRIKKLAKPSSVIAAGLALLTPVALSMYAGSANAGTPTSSWTVLVGNQAAHKAIQGEKFLTPDLTIDQGDTVTWQANSAEPHTVTFFADGVQTSTPEFNPGDPDQATPVADGGDFAPDTAFNSGVLSTVDIPLLPFGTERSYTLHFPSDLPVGTYTYYCLVHGVSMRGEIHVQPAGSAYPQSQADINADAAFLANAIVADGKAQLAQAKKAATNHKVILGTDDMIAMVGRYIKGKVVVHKGDTVKWVNNMSMGAPHTVTIGAPHAGPAVLAPYGNPTHYRTGDLSSGVIAPHGSYKVTFKKAGTYHYYCLFHSELGMKGVVVVKP